MRPAVSVSRQSPSAGAESLQLFMMSDAKQTSLRHKATQIFHQEKITSAMFSQRILESDRKSPADVTVKSDSPTLFFPSKLFAHSQR